MKPRPVTAITSWMAQTADGDHDEQVQNARHGDDAKGTGQDGTAAVPGLAQSGGRFNTGERGDASLPPRHQPGPRCWPRMR